MDRGGRGGGPVLRRQKPQSSPRPSGGVPAVRMAPQAQGIPIALFQLCRPAAHGTRTPCLPARQSGLPHGAPLSAPQPRCPALTKASLGAFLGGAILLGSIFSCECSTRARAPQADSSSLGLHPCGEGKAGLVCGSPAWAGSQPPAPTCVGAAIRSPVGRRRRDRDAEKLP